MWKLALLQSKASKEEMDATSPTHCGHQKEEGTGSNMEKSLVALQGARGASDHPPFTVALAIHSKNVSFRTMQNDFQVTSGRRRWI